MSASTALVAKEEMGYRGISLLNAVEDRHGGVIVNMEEPLDSVVFASSLKASLSNWRQQVECQICNNITSYLSNIINY